MVGTVAVVVVVEGVVDDDIAESQIVNCQILLPTKDLDLRLKMKSWYPLTYLQTQDFPFHNIDQQWLHLLAGTQNMFRLVSIENCAHRK